MTTIYYDATDLDDFSRVLHKICKCGHEVYQHGNTMGGWDIPSSCLHVSQCVMCDCKKFEEANDN